MSIHQERLQEAMREAAAEYLVREANPQSMITVTRAEVSEGGRDGVIYITVLPEQFEDAAVKFANRHRTEFGEYFKKKVRGAHLPHLEFRLDVGEKNRQRLDELTS